MLYICYIVVYFSTGPPSCLYLITQDSEFSRNFGQHPKGYTVSNVSTYWSCHVSLMICKLEKLWFTVLWHYLCSLSSLSADYPDDRDSDQLIRFHQVTARSEINVWHSHLIHLLHTIPSTIGAYSEELFYCIKNTSHNALAITLPGIQPRLQSFVHKNV